MEAGDGGCDVDAACDGDGDAETTRDDGDSADPVRGGGGGLEAVHGGGSCSDAVHGGDLVAVHGGGGCAVATRGRGGGCGCAAAARGGGGCTDAARGGGACEVAARGGGSCAVAPRGGGAVPMRPATTAVVRMRPAVLAWMRYGWSPLLQSSPSCYQDSEFFATIFGLSHWLAGFGEVLPLCLTALTMQGLSFRVEHRLDLQSWFAGLQYELLRFNDELRGNLLRSPVMLTPKSTASQQTSHMCRFRGGNRRGFPVCQAECTSI
ncbi:Os01g0537250 [Oryza sativa Japonica Group]|jgi:hypothetical protein|uniref:Os01g0537250 protein n=1 Tax=Oryza sativa subsp. japonica TaxID=39947 RepID=A0A0P0V3N0_ORYSJ|nr:hypothetical protein DAI22_08g069628 [Oryza sativa Japonica Group]BAS72551.1 Os01g0537250 [Oryza sativa Japonica Group]